MVIVLRDLAESRGKIQFVDVNLWIRQPLHITFTRVHE